MPKLVCGILESRPSGVAEKARDLTISWLRWGYFGRIIAADNVDRILTNAAGGGYDYCLIQSCGHILAERSGVQGSAGVSFFEALERWISQGDFFVAAKVADPGGGLDRRCLLIDLRYYRQSGRPSFESCPPGATFIAESLRRGIPIREFGPEIESYLVDLGPDLDLHPGFLQGLEEQIEKAQRGVFVLNFESYRDVETPPADFTGPVAVLYSVAAGLKPNRILATHGFDQRTEVVYFDYSSAGLAFRRMLLEEWSGRDYPAFLRSLVPPPASLQDTLLPLARRLAGCPGLGRNGAAVGGRDGALGRRWELRGPVGGLPHAAARFSAFESPHRAEPDPGANSGP